MRPPHGPSLPGQLGACLVVAIVLIVWTVAIWAIWAWGQYPLRAFFP